MRQPFWITSTTRVSLEFGKPYSTKPQPNPEHIGNFRLFLESMRENGTWIPLMDIRGFSIYKKKDGGRDKWVIKCPNYTAGNGKNIAFVLLMPEVQKMIFEELAKVSPADFKDKYSREDWPIWFSAPVSIKQTIENSPDAHFENDPDVSDLRDHGDL